MPKPKTKTTKYTFDEKTVKQKEPVVSMDVVARNLHANRTVLNPSRKNAEGKYGGIRDVIQDSGHCGSGVPVTKAPDPQHS